MQELVLRFLDRYNGLLTNPLEVKDGFCTPPAEPGWGTDFREDVIAGYSPEVYRWRLHQDAVLRLLSFVENKQNEAGSLPVTSSE